MIKLIVTDLDGTLLNNQKMLSQMTIDTLVEAQKQGIRVVLATGRNYQSLEPIYLKLQMDQFKSGVIIGVNGEESYYFDENRYEKIASLTGENATSILKTLSLMLFNVQIMNDQQIKNFSYKWLRTAKKMIFNLKHRDMKMSFEGYTKHWIEINRCEVITHEVNKVGIAQLNVYMTLMLPIIRRLYKNQYEVLKVSRGWAEIMPKGISKGSGVERVMAHYHILPEEVLVFGDGENDLSMFEVTNHSYAPSNALRSVKKKANYQCLSNEEDGVAKVVAKYLNNG